MKSKLFLLKAAIPVVPQRVDWIILVAIACAITYQNVQFYMFEYKNSAYFQDANGEFALEVGLMA